MQPEQKAARIQKITENKEFKRRAQTKYSIALENPAYTEPDMKVRTSTFDLNQRKHVTPGERQTFNGDPGEKIEYKRGLRQGDPLSPMLFILVMDVLGFMIRKATEEGLLQPLARRALQHRISIYADDVVIFLRPSTDDINITMDILNLFGRASGLKTNMEKSSVLPIQCQEEDRHLIHSLLPCQLLDFPCKYLGVHLSLHKLTKAQVQPIIDRISDQLPGWKADR